MTVYSQATGAPAPPFVFGINGIKLDDDLPEKIDDDGMYILEIPGDKAPVYNADGTLNVTASILDFVVCYIVKSLLDLNTGRNLPYMLEPIWINV